MAQINHVSVNALNLDESVRFYEDLLGVERIPTLNFGIPVQWLALGRTQLHLFDATSSRRAITTWGSRLMTSSPSTGRLSGGTPSINKAFGNNLVELPGDVVQLYVRDPAGNLVEIDHHGVDRLPHDLRAELKGLWDFNSQSEENMRGRLFVP